MSRVAAGIGGGTVDEEVGATKERLHSISEYIHTHSPLRRWPSGSVFGVTTGIGGGTIDGGVGATGRRTN